MIPFRAARPAVAVPALLVALAWLLVSASGVLAAERPFSLRYSSNVSGQITIAGNTIMRCPTDTVDPLMNSGCLGAQAGTSSRNNNSFDMQWLDVDSDASTFTSSSSDLALPAGSRVQFAGLYWTGLNRTGQAISGANGFRADPQPPPDVAAIGTVKLKVPGSSTYATVTAAGADVNTAAIAVGAGYGAFADVTTLVAGAGAGTYTVADVQTGTGGNAYAGWSLVVAYSNPAEPLRNLSVFDGLRVVSGSQQLDIPLSGFKTPSSGAVNTTIGVVAAEGDAGATGDYLTVNENLLTDAVHPSNNTENSTIANRGAYVTTRNPAWVNNLGYDSSLFSADGFLGNGDTSAIFRAKTNGDTYAPQAITFATELFSPDVTLTKTSSGGSEPGDTVTYTLTATNSGAGNATSVELTDVLPPGITYASGPTVTSGTGTGSYDAGTGRITAYLGTGSSSGVGGTLAPAASATVTFTGTIALSEPLGDVITNTGTLGFVSEDLGLPISVEADDEITVAYPDPGITKSVASSSGNQYAFDIDVGNQGTLPTTGTVTVNDTAPAGATFASTPTGSGWSCSTTGSPATAFTCTRSDALAPGGTYPTIRATMDFTPGTNVENTVSLANGSGGEPNDASSPSRLNNSSTAQSGLSPLATLALNKAALTGTISYGTLGGFRMEVRNTGPSDATNATLVDTLPVGLAYESYTSTQGSCSTAPGSGGTTTVTCALGTIPANDVATVVVRARPAISLLGQTVTNTATASSDVTPSPVTDTATLTIRPGADLSLTKAVSPTGSVGQGQPVTYTLAVANDGPASASSVRVVDRLPAAIDPATVTTTPAIGSGCTLSGSTVICTVGTLANGASSTVTITGTTRNPPSTAADRQAINRANVFASTDDPEPSNNADEATVVITDAADLQVNATGPASIAAGATGEVAFVTTNNGPSAAQGSSLTITIPAQLTPIAAPAGCTISGQTVTCALGTMATGDAITTTVGVQAAPGLVEVTATASADATSTTPDFDDRNNSDVAPFITGPVADLVITKAASAATVTAGGTVDWTLAISNSGPFSSNGSVVTDTLPAGLTPLSISSSVPDACSIAGQVITCQAGEIVPGSGYQALVVTRVAPGTEGSSITNTAVLAPGSESDPNSANNTASASVSVAGAAPPTPSAAAAAEVTSGPDLRITKRASARRVAPGGTLRYAIRVSNLGGGTSTGATMRDVLPPGLTPLRATVNGNRCSVRGRIVTCPLGTVTPGSTVPIGIAARVGRTRAGATLLNTARLSTGGQTDPDTGNNVARARTTVTVPRGMRATLGIRARVGPSVVRRGRSVLVSATVRTTSSYPANTVRICVSVPRSLRYVSSTGTKLRSSVCWTRAQVRAGASYTVRYRAVARASTRVRVLGTARAGNAATVRDRSEALPPRVTG